MKRWAVLGAVAVVAAAVGAGLALWLREPAQLPPAVEPAAEPDTPGVAPAFTLADLDGNMRSLDEWAGRTVIVNFWATWCAPCRREIPALTELQAEYDESQLVVLGIAIDEVDAVRDYVERIGMGYTTLVGQLDAIQTAAAYGNHIGALPYTVIVGPNGRIRWIHAGEVTRAMLDEALEAARSP